ncbi:unnamed protein product, partial [marine sediment metagenome]
GLNSPFDILLVLFKGQGMGRALCQVRYPSLYLAAEIEDCQS